MYGFVVGWFERVSFYKSIRTKITFSPYLLTKINVEVNQDGYINKK